MTDKYQVLREAAAKATPGPWRFDGEVVASDRGVVTRSPRITERCAPGGMSDAHFIAAASPDVIASLLSDLDAADAKAEKAERELEEVRRDLTEAIIRESEANRELGREQMRSEAARRERADALAKLDAMTNQAVMLSGRRAVIVDADAGKVAELEAEVKRLREAMPTVHVVDAVRRIIDRSHDHDDVITATAWTNAARGGAK